MRTDLPQRMIEEAMKLESEGTVTLYRLDLRPPNSATFSLFICPHKSVVWQGAQWLNETPCMVTDTGIFSSGETVRPKFSIVNPEGVFSRYVHQKYVDNMLIRRYRVLRGDIENDVNAFELSQWRVSKVVSLDRDIVICELRSSLDGPLFRLPIETYRPPKYPTVSVQ
jgi:phage-related protein